MVSNILVVSMSPPPSLANPSSAVATAAGHVRAGALTRVFWFTSVTSHAVKADGVVV